MTQPEILYEDAQLIVCYKPAGIATQTKKLGQKDMVSILLNHIAQEGTGQPFIGVVPVSYTHLDVYKRQPQRGTDDSGG